MSEDEGVQEPHTHDWMTRLCEKANHCYHLAASEIGNMHGLDGKVVQLANCLKCSTTIAVTEQYSKTDRQCGDKTVYIKKLYKATT